jgi:hypothetical protein
MACPDVPARRRLAPLLYLHPAAVELLDMRRSYT